MPPFSSSLSRRSEEHTSELQSLRHLVCRLLLEKKKKNNRNRQRDGARINRRPRGARHDNVLRATYGAPHLGRLPFCALCPLVFFLFFFLMIGRPPRSTLFPTRRSSDLPPEWLDSGTKRYVNPTGRFVIGGPMRSEEHTSELQSLRHLVCRLLLEKKK